MDVKQHYSGLTDAQVKESREKFGSNLLTPPQKTPLWKLFFEKFQVEYLVSGEYIDKHLHDKSL